jgi:hypothetical protein
MKLFTKEIDQKLFDQYIMGSDLENQMVVAKIFNPYGNGVWYLLNSDPNDPDYIWAIVDLFDVEVGSVSREELETLKVPPFRLGLERDLYFTPVNAKKLYESLLSGEKFEDGGTIDIIKDKSGDNWVFPNNPNGDTYGIKLAAGGMTAGRWYKDNSGQELRYIGESQGKLLFNDGQKVVYKDESDFEDAPEEKRMFGFFEDGGQLKDEFLEDMSELHQDISHITLVDGSRVSGEELRNAHHKFEHGGEMDSEYEGDDRWFVLENGSIIKGKLIKKTANVLADVLRKKNPNKEYSVIFIEDYEDYDEFASGGFTSSFSGTPDRRRVTKEKGGELAQWYVVSAKENKVISGGFDNENEAKKYMYDLFEKNKDFSLAIKKIAKSSGVGFTPYGETKGIYKIYYKADGKPQTEIWETKEMAVNAAKRYSSPQMQGEYTNVKVFDEDGSEVDYMSEPKYVRGGMLMHGFNEGDKVIEIYKGQGIVESNGIIVVVNPDHGTRFIIDLDESKPTGQKSMNMSMEQQLKSAKEYIDWVSKDKETPDTLVSVIKDYGTYGRYAKGGMLTDAKKEAILKKKGNIIIFKEVLEPTDEGRKSIAVQRFVKSRKTGAVKLEGSAYDTQWFESMQDLINAVDWSKWESDKYAKGGELMKHKHNEHITIELIEPTNKGWKVKQIETHSVRGRKLSTPKEKVAYFSKEELSDLFEPTMARGGRTKFKDKVESIKASLLKRKKVPLKVQKDYGKTYSPKEAEEAATRIAGSIVQKEKRKPRVSKILEKMKKGTQIKKKKSTFKDRMKQLSTKIKERKSKSTK